METEESHDLTSGGPGKQAVLFQFKPEDLRTGGDKGGKNSNLGPISSLPAPANAHRLCLAEERHTTTMGGLSFNA